jgi:hypothetical protein
LTLDAMPSFLALFTHKLGVHLGLLCSVMHAGWGAWESAHELWHCDHGYELRYYCSWTASEKHGGCIETCVAGVEHHANLLCRMPIHIDAFESTRRQQSHINFSHIACLHAAVLLPFSDSPDSQKRLYSGCSGFASVYCHLLRLLGTIPVRRNLYTFFQSHIENPCQ